VRTVCAPQPPNSILRLTSVGALLSDVQLSRQLELSVQAIVLDRESVVP